MQFFMQAPVKKHVSSSRHATGKVTVANWVLPLASCVKHSADFSPLKRSKVMVSDRLWGGSANQAGECSEVWNI